MEIEIINVLCSDNKDTMYGLCWHNAMDLASYLLYNDTLSVCIMGCNCETGLFDNPIGFTVPYNKSIKQGETIMLDDVTWVK